MKINELTKAKSSPGPTDWFTGNTWMEHLGTLSTPAPTKVIRVTFAPGARTAWHSHPQGQVLHILGGVARIGREGEPVREAHAGDTVEILPGERHWHGAAPELVMVHLAVYAEDADAGLATVWEEQVGQRDYEALAGA